MATDSATLTLTKDNFNTTIDRDGIVLVDWWASWCGPCRMFAPIFEEAARENPDITFGKVDTEAEQGLAGALQIRSIPTIMAFKEGVLVFAQPGALPGGQQRQHPRSAAGRAAPLQLPLDGRHCGQPAQRHARRHL